MPEHTDAVEDKTKNFGNDDKSGGSGANPGTKPLTLEEMKENRLITLIDHLKTEFWVNVWGIAIIFMVGILLALLPSFFKLPEDIKSLGLSLASAASGAFFNRKTADIVQVGKDGIL